MLYGALPESRLALKQANHRVVGVAKLALEKALAHEYEGTMFLRNLHWFALGLVISVAGLALSALLLPDAEALFGLAGAGWLAVWWGVVFFAGRSAIKGFFGTRGIVAKLSALFGLLFLVPFIGAGIAMPVLVFAGAGSSLLYIFGGAALSLLVLNAVFFFLLRAPSVPGRKLLDQIEGFRLYLSTAEEERLSVLNPPQKTPELFERYLPYALALDCENEWNAKFTAVLAVAAAAAPLWYSGSHWDAGRTGAFTDSLGSSLAASTAAAATAPGSSSGSGGGGSSGGGGGGGGGSGW